MVRTERGNAVGITSLPSARLSPRAFSLQQALPQLLQLAREGLVREGEVDPSEADHWLAIVRERAAQRRTAASWQRQLYEQLRRRLPQQQAWSTLVLHYLEQSLTEQPVHTWPQPELLARR
jgi:hypothetical protein